MMEREAKIRVESLEPVRARLASLGLSPIASLTEHDVYFNAPDRDFAETDEALRIRSTGEGSSLTYKGPKLGPGPVKAREELTLLVDSAGMAGRILERLGFSSTAMVVKRRETFRVEGTSVTLDTVEGLGPFVEIEAPAGLPEPEAVALIQRVKELLGATGEETTLSYLEMILATR